MAVRIDLVRNRIQQFESNPLNMGTDAANTGLEMLRGQLDQAVREQQKPAVSPNCETASAVA